MKVFGVFLLVVALFVVAIVRKCDDGPKQQATKPAPVAPVVKPEPPIVQQPPPPSEPVPPAPAPVAQPEPEKPPIPGATFVAAASTDWFALGKKHVFWCEGEIRAVPKQGGEEETLGDCNSHDLHAAGEGVVFSHDDAIWEATPGESTKKITMADSIIFDADDMHVYFVVPGFDDNPDQGVYRIRRSGGMAEKLYVGRKSEHQSVHVDDSTIWISGFFSGTLVKRAKAGGKVSTVLSGQKGMSELTIDGDYLYWQVETPREVRRRKKSGGKVEVVVTDVDQGKFDVHAGTVYALTGPNKHRNLVAVTPGEPAKTLATDIDGMRVYADADGIFVYIEGRGIYSLPLSAAN